MSSQNLRPLRTLSLWLSILLGIGLMSWGLRMGGAGGEPVVMVVMDPLAKPLACACVKGYAQRDYDALGAYLSRTLSRRVRVVYGESLDKALQSKNRGTASLIVGKQSVVQSDAALVGVRVHPVCRLTGKEGTTTLTGLFVVKLNDPAQTLADLKGRPILFGPSDAAEKHSAAMAALRDAGVALPTKIETRAGCTDAALDVQDSNLDLPPAGVISSYALPLLEGCGSIEKGSLKVVGHTAQVPFVTVFATANFDPELEGKLTRALLAVRDSAPLLKSLESKAGFVPMSNESSEWPGWRGANRDGQVAWLPEKLPANATFAWQKKLNGPALAGVAAAQGVVVVADRDPTDRQDVFHCLRARDGETLWTVAYPAPGEMDYGLSARATPLIEGDRVCLLGAQGTLLVVELATGKILWKRELTRDFEARTPKWGWCASPLLVDGLLIVNPGSAQASLVGLNWRTGEIVWKSPGAAAAYAGFIIGRFGGQRQIIGYDAVSLGGWDPQTGKRLWTLSPPVTGDFNVPTPVAIDGKLLVATENNGTRLYGFNANGTINPQPLAASSELSPDASTPVVAAGQVIGCSGSGLHGLDLAGGLKPLWSGLEDTVSDFGSLIASRDRVLALSFRGELLLLNPSRTSPEVSSRLRLFDGDPELYSHPALSGHRLYVRSPAGVCCLVLDPGNGAEPSLAQSGR